MWRSILYDDIYPPYLPHDQEPPVLGAGQPPLHGPHYLLGWVVKLTPESESGVKDYTDSMRLYSADLWVELGYDTGPDLGAGGITLPEVRRLDMRFAFFMIARITAHTLKYLSTDEGMEESVSRALRIFGNTDPDSFDKDKLIWIRSPVTKETGEVLPYIGTFDGEGGIPQPMADILNHKYRHEEWRMKQRAV